MIKHSRGEKILVTPLQKCDYKSVMGTLVKRNIVLSKTAM